MKIIFFGSDDFALTGLEALLASGHSVTACVAPPDKPKGRGMKMAESPVKQRAREAGLPVLQPADIKEEAFVSQLRDFDSDLFVVIAYGRILPSVILDIPKICAVNVHGSLLPRYRGAAPINWAIINGERETGISVIRLNPKMDAGDIILKNSIRIAASDDAGILREKLKELSIPSLLEAVGQLEAGKASFTPQASDQVTVAPKLSKELGRIDWTQSAVKIRNLARGLSPKPGAYTVFGGKLLKILETQPVDVDAAPGTVTDITAEGFIVAAGEGGVLVKKVLPEAGKPMDARSFTVGHNLVAGHTFPRC